jgi:hypothetical protein
MPDGLAAFKDKERRPVRRAMIGSAALLMTIAGAPAQETIPTTGLNCSIASPPSESGLAVAGHAGFFKVFPRKSNMPRDYTGCQIVWSVESDDLRGGQEVTYKRAAIFYFQRGLLALAHDEQAGLTCRYQGGKPTVQDGSCDTRDIPISSAPAGCLEEMIATQAVPKRCEQMD